MRSLAIIAALFLPTSACHAASPPLKRQVGDVFEIRRSSETSYSTTGGSSGSSRDRDAIVVRVVGTGPAGRELEYDLPKNTTAEDRARQWQFPARVLKPASGPLQLLNHPELEARATAWLKAASLTRAACGRWIFTWNAFRVDCDPQSVIETIEGFDPGPDGLSDGAQYRDSKALSPAPLKRTTVSADGAVFFVEMPVDPDAVRRDRAETDVVAAEVMKEPRTLESALLERSAEKISGKITITFETDPAGHVRRRTKVTTLEITTPGGEVESQTATETLERRWISRPGA